MMMTVKPLHYYDATMSRSQSFLGIFNHKFQKLASWSKCFINLRFLPTVAAKWWLVMHQKSINNPSQNKIEVIFYRNIWFRLKFCPRSRGHHCYRAGPLPGEWAGVRLWVAQIEPTHFNYCQLLLSSTPRAGPILCNYKCRKCLGREAPKCLDAEVLWCFVPGA